MRPALPDSSFVICAVSGALAVLAVFSLWRGRGAGNSSSPASAGPSGPSGGVGYPCVYRISVGWKIALSAILGILCAAALAAIWAIAVLAPDGRNVAPRLILVALVSAVICGAVLYWVDVFVFAIVLHRDRLEIHRLGKGRVIRREDIESRQTRRVQNSPPTLELRLKDSGSSRVKLPIMWQIDNLWHAWFENIPDLDVEAAKSFEASIQANADLGATPEERRARLAGARKLTKVAILANTALCFWAFVYPRPYALVIAILVLAPWAAIWAISRAPTLYGFNAGARGAQPDLTPVLIAPGLCLSLRAFLDVHIVHFALLMPWMIAVAALTVACLVWVLPAARAKPAAILFVALLFAAYGYGASALADALLDHSATTTFPTRVERKHVSGGRNKSPELTLAPWGPGRESGDVTVSWDLYRSTRVGDTVCVGVRSGALGVPWYRVSQCPPGGAS